MFIRSNKVRSSSGEIHEYVRIVESVREDGRVKQQVIANLGRRDTLEAVLPSLIRFLQGEDDAQKLTDQSRQEGALEPIDSSTWGPMLVVRHFFQQLGLWQLLDAGRRWSKQSPEEDPNDDWPSRVLALIANRLTCPTSEHGLAAWLETYFEGQGPALAKHGHSRDGQPRKVQAVVGVVMVAGWPITHHVWAGNTRDSKTVKEVVKDLSKRLQSRVAQGQLKQPEKIGAAAQRVLSRHHGHRYYDWALQDGELRYFEHPLHLAREKKYEGKYLIQTDQSEMGAVDAVAHDKELNEVERGFHTLKDPLAMRPIWHRCDRRVKAHIFVAALAFLMDRMLERALRDARVNLSSTAAWQALQTIRSIRFRVNDVVERTTVTAGSAIARQVVRALGLTDLQPPTSPQSGATAV